MIIFVTLLNLEIIGYYPARKFPHFTRDINLPYFRPIVYWQPVIKTDTKGKASIRFVASDAIGNFEVRIKGINEIGEILEAKAICQTVDSLKNK